MVTLKYAQIYTLLLLFGFNLPCTGQGKTNLSNNITSEPREVFAIGGPTHITRTIKQDRKGNIWFASWDGVFLYDGKSFTNIAKDESSARFFSVLEDRRGKFWFSSVGSGAFYYDGYFFRNFTTKDGLASDRVTDMYEDKAGTIWFATEGGVSRYDGRSFRNFTTKDGLPHNDVGAILEDKTGKFWFGTRGPACFYDGKKFTVITHQGKPFTNVRTIIEDRKGNIWLCGNDGLWRYDGKTFTNFAQNDVGYLYEDKKGNIWISYEESPKGRRVLFRYDAKSLSDVKPTVTKIKTKEEVIFGMLEAYDGSMWLGTANGVYRYDRNTVNDLVK